MATSLSLSFSLCFCYFFGINWKLGKHLSIVMKEMRRCSLGVYFVRIQSGPIDHTHSHTQTKLSNKPVHCWDVAIFLPHCGPPIPNMWHSCNCVYSIRNTISVFGCIEQNRTEPNRTEHTRIGYKSSIQKENILEIVATFALSVFCCVRVLSLCVCGTCILSTNSEKCKTLN